MHSRSDTGKKSYPTSWLLVGGLVFGVYFGLGLVYFETFEFGKDTSLLVQGPVFGLMVVVCIALAMLLFSGKRSSVHSARAAALVGVPLLGFGLATVLLGLYGGWASEVGFSWDLLTRIAFHLLLVGLLPVVAVLVFLQGGGQRGEEKVATLDPQAENEEEHPVFSLPTGPGGEGFEVRLEDLIMVEAADNYCKFHCFIDGQRKVRTFRIALKEVAQSLDHEPRFHRCHRSFLVNAAMVEVIQGVSQAYKLQMREVDELVPVSRSFDMTPLRALLEGS